MNNYIADVTTDNISNITNSLPFYLEYSFKRLQSDLNGLIAVYHGLSIDKFFQVSYSF